MAFDETLATRIRDAISRKKNVEEKKMFGGIGFLLNGNMLVGVWKDSLIVRLGPDDGDRYDRHPGPGRQLHKATAAQPLQDVALVKGLAQALHAVGEDHDRSRLPEQAQAVAKNLGIFEKAGGVAMSDRLTGVQWDLPYGWAPIQLLAVEGLRRYGFNNAADRISREFVSTVLENFQREGTIREKYNVVTRSTDLCVYRYALGISSHTISPR